MQYERITIVTVQRREGRRRAHRPPDPGPHPDRRDPASSKDRVAGRPVAERFAVPNGAEVFVTEDGRRSRSPAPSARAKWDPHAIPIISEEGGNGPVRGHQARARPPEGEGLRPDDRRRAASPSWSTRATCTRTIEIVGRPGATIHHRGVLHPGAGQPPSPQRREGVGRARLLAKTPREVVPDPGRITGGLPRVTDIFEARRPRETARPVMAGGAGKVRTRTRPEASEQAASSGSNRRTTHGRVDRRGAWELHQVPASAHLQVSTTGSTSRPATRWCSGRWCRTTSSASPGADAQCSRVPGPRGAGGVPVPAGGHRRQAHRDHRRPDAPEGEGEGLGPATPGSCPAR